MVRPGPLLLEVRALLLLALPLALSNIAPFGFSAVNLAILGRQGADQLAAGALAYGLFILSLSILTGLDAAAMTLVANALGREKDRQSGYIRILMQHAALTALAYCAALWGIFWWSEQLLLATGQDPAIAAAAGGMIRYLMWALLPYTVFKLIRALIGAHGEQRLSFIVVVGGVMLNGLLGWLLIRGNAGDPAADLRGAALATCLASTAMAATIVAISSVQPQFRHYRLLRQREAFDATVIRRLLSLGLPISITLLFETAVFYAAMIIMGRFGVAQLAAHSIAMQIVSMAFKLPVGLGQAASIRVARFNGAEDFAAARTAGWATFSVTIVLALSTATMMLLFPLQLIGWFVDTSAPENGAIIAYARQFLYLAALFQIVDALQGSMAGVLRGTQDTLVPMLIAGIGYWFIGLPAGSLLALHFGMEGYGIWVGLAIGLAVVAAFMTLRWMRIGSRAAARSALPP